MFAQLSGQKVETYRPTFFSRHLRLPSEIALGLIKLLEASCVGYVGPEGDCGQIWGQSLFQS